ncbi:MAG: transposase [Oleiphilaceae bacterium]|nr:transposase [Oleiphilaceae bacterium]
MPNCPHHVVQRGHDKKAVFVCDEDYAHYLNTLEKAKKEFDVAVYSFCLMTNHVHLILAPKNRPECLSALMKKVSSKQTRYTNKLEGRSGTLWESRFKSSPIETDTYLLQCSRYVELNPVKARMVSEPEDWAWSSYGVKVGLKAGEHIRTWLDADQTYLGLSPNKKERHRRYRAFVKSAVPEQERIKISQALERSQLTGSGKFVDEIERRMGLRVEERGPGRPKNRSVPV